MCNKRSSVKLKLENKVIRVDECLRGLIKYLNNNGLETLACCCGHGRYEETIIYRDDDGSNRELISGIVIRREKRFYLRDELGFFYLPEVDERIADNKRLYHKYHRTLYAAECNW